MARQRPVHNTALHSSRLIWDWGTMVRDRLLVAGRQCKEWGERFRGSRSSTRGRPATRMRCLKYEMAKHIHEW